MFVGMFELTTRILTTVDDISRTRFGGYHNSYRSFHWLVIQDVPQSSSLINNTI